MTVEYKFNSQVVKSKLGIPISQMHNCMLDGLVKNVRYSSRACNCTSRSWMFNLLDVYRLLLYNKLLAFGLQASLACEIITECNKEGMFRIGDNTSYSSNGIEVTVPIATVIEQVQGKLL